MFKFLWQGVGTLSAHTRPTLPQYEPGEKEDRVDLQIKALMYMYRRCGLGSLTQPLAKFQVDAPASLESSKLDYMYNITAFERMMQQDEHRVLVDWHKNKFRSLCLLSERPKEINQLPALAPDQGFRFMVLECNVPDHVYVDVLSESDIYVEHAVSMDMRRRIVKNALEVVRGGVARHLNKNDRSFIIRYYVNKMAVEVQVDRLYRGTLRSKMNEMTQEVTPPLQPSPLAKKSSHATLKSSSPNIHAASGNITPRTSPRKMKSSSTLSPSKKSLNKHKSRDDLRASSPVKQYIDSPPPNAVKVPKLLQRSSNPNLRMACDNGNNAPPVPQLPPSPTKSIGSVKSNTSASGGILSEEAQKELRSQARIAVKNRLDRERRALKMLICGQ